MKKRIEYITKNNRYINPIYIKPIGIMLHSTGTPQPKSSAYINNWNDKSASVCVHGIIDGNTGDYTQLLPYNYKSNHCGSGKNGNGNLMYISVEMCEPSSIVYTSGANLLVVNKADAVEVTKRTYRSAVSVFADICKEHGWNPSADGVIIGHAEGYQRGIATNHGDPEHLWKQLGIPYTMDTFRSDVAEALKGNAETGKDEKTLSSDFRGLSEAAAAEKLLHLCKDIAPKYGLLPSVAAAQSILESGYVSTDLAVNANNVCGMKCNLSGNTWPGSTWDEKSRYTKKTAEQDAKGNVYYVYADFRKYGCIEDSIADRCAYLLGATNGNDLRYLGIKECSDYRDQIQLIKNGGYATDTKYVDKICSIIEKYNLSRYDAVKEITEKTSKLYRIQTGSYEYQENAKKMVETLSMYGFDAFVDHVGNNYVVIAGSFEKRNNAEELLKKIKKTGIAAFIQ